MRLVLATICLACTTSAAPDDPRPARSVAMTLRKETTDPAASWIVSVRGLDAANLAKLAKVDWDARRWSELLSLSIESGKGKPLPIAGTYSVVDDELRFKPKFAIEPSLAHVAELDPARLPEPRNEPRLREALKLPAARRRPPASVVRVDPPGQVLPENLLKFYIHFSAPMSRGEVYDRVRLVDDKGETVDGAFLAIGEELWDPSGKRITLLLDPGRIKRGLRPREEQGPILVAGKKYTLQVDRQWPDATGQPMNNTYSRIFLAGPADMTQPDPKTWKVTSPDPRTRDFLMIEFPEPLDRAMLDRALLVYDAEGKRVPGRVGVDETSTGWYFTPDVDWRAGAYHIEVDPELEDLAGNSVARAFEVDVEKPVEAAAQARRVKLPFTISADRRP